MMMSRPELLLRVMSGFMVLLHQGSVLISIAYATTGVHENPVAKSEGHVESDICFTGLLDTAPGGLTPPLMGELTPTLGEMPQPLTMGVKQLALMTWA